MAENYYLSSKRSPFTGFRKTSFQAKVSTKRWLNGYFNGSPNYSQVTGITRGKVYEVTGVTGYGDPCDFHFIDDNGKEQSLGEMFFVDPDADESEDNTVDKSVGEESV